MFPLSMDCDKIINDFDDANAVGHAEFLKYATLDKFPTLDL
jgi:hypothetical protein